jgi:CheY-like chemotaxis protein
VETENVQLDEYYRKPYRIATGRYCKISITDTGIGMDEETRARIFEPFFTTKEMGRGTGLGLASAYGIVKNHKGYIDVYSEKGHGTTFNIYLPASSASAPHSEKELHEETLTGSETILLIDDETMILDVAAEILMQLGYDVLTANSGEAALADYARKRDRIDLVVLDMLMPDMGGPEIFQRLKALNPEVKVLLASGFSQTHQATELLREGCRGFIQKPFSMKKLSQKLREVLDDRPE